MQTDILVIGTGIAGLTFAIKIAEKYPEKQVCIVTKSEAIESNTRYAQGGIAVVWNEQTDSFQKHIDDTMVAGDFLNDQHVVDFVVKEAPSRLREMIQWGVQFDKDETGSYNLGLEGGHSENRILHHKDITGYEIEKILLQKIFALRNITMLTHYFSVDLIVHNNECHGASLINLNTLKTITIYAGITLLATGGIGQVYENTTNPSIATGDGIAMAIRAGASIQDMEFIQFHPTALYNVGESPSFLISEAVRGMGAVLKNADNLEFMDTYSTRGSLASRDIVARGIAYEMKYSNSTNVFLDCTMINPREFMHHFPNIYDKCKTVGIDISQEMIPVVPAAHYLCGGIKTDEWGKTSIENLYACGECACTGLHGANRLASNSLLEAVVFAHRAFLHSSGHMQLTAANKEFNIDQKTKQYTNYDHHALKLKQSIHKATSSGLGILRDKSSLMDVAFQLQAIQKKLAEAMQNDKVAWQMVELHNMAMVANEIAKASILRKENKGLFYSKDN